MTLLNSDLYMKHTFLRSVYMNYTHVCTVSYKTDNSCTKFLRMYVYISVENNTVKARPCPKVNQCFQTDRFG